MPLADEQGDAAPPSQTSNTRALAREIFLDTLAECSVPAAFQRNLEYDHGVLRIGEDLYNLDAYSRVFVVAIGKAAHTMTDALVGEVGGRVEGVVVAPTEPAHYLHRFTYFKGGHPMPTQESVTAARHILRELQHLNEFALVIFLISGGGSALAETPLYESISLEDLVQTYHTLVHSSAPITEINAIRKHLSAVKGGRLAATAAPAHQISILISDVPENALDALASGPTMPDSSTTEDCYRIAAKHGLIQDLPPSVRELFQHNALEETPKADDWVFVRSRWWPILSSATAAKAAASKAAALGFAVEIDNSCDDWDYGQAADHLLARLKELRRGASRVCLISAGEVVVRVAGKPGVGGRNQQFALYCAEKIVAQDITVLSAGTDGIDGNSKAAGAVVDGSTIERAREQKLDSAEALARFNAYTIFEKLGDAVITGPTGNNLRDLRILLAC
jgi:glycerate 2-kinase